MSYATIALIQRDMWIRLRITACAQLEGVIDPAQWAADHMWELAAQPGWGEAWAYALATNPGDEYEPGRDEAVITDGMILSAVQQLAGAG